VLHIKRFILSLVFPNCFCHFASKKLLRNKNIILLVEGKNKNNSIQNMPSIILIQGPIQLLAQVKCLHSNSFMGAIWNI
jgi:hypothetical protein